MTFDYVRIYLTLSTPETTSLSYTDMWALIKALSPLLTPVKSSLLAKDRVTDGRGIFLVPAQKPDQKAIFFGRAKNSLVHLEDSEDQGKLPDFSVYTTLQPTG